MQPIHIPTMTEAHLHNKRIIVRVDFDIALNAHKEVVNDTRLQKTLPTLTYLLKEHNKLILISKLGRPQGRDETLSLKPVAHDLAKYFPSYEIVLVEDFLSEKGKEQLAHQTEKQIILLENIRFYPEEKANDASFAKELASLGEAFVMDAFAMAHRKEASVVGIPHYLPSYAGLLFAEEVKAIESVLQNPKKPVVALIGGAKTSTKLPLLYKLAEIADYLLLGGGIANTFLQGQGFAMGKSLVEEGQEAEIHKILAHAKRQQTEIVLPRDFLCALSEHDKHGELYPVNHIPHAAKALDIGPETQALFGNLIAKAQTIIWNGPFGYTENPAFARGSDFLYYAITQNTHAYSLVGGGDTLAALSKKEYLDHITHISTGGGAMLEFIEKGTLPGIEALQRK